MSATAGAVWAAESRWPPWPDAGLHLVASSCGPPEAPAAGFTTALSFSEDIPEKTRFSAKGSRACPARDGVAKASPSY